MRARQIIDIRSADKWVELWFHDGKSDPEDWDECCKWYMLQDVISSSGLNARVLKRGYLGLWLLWPEGSDRPTHAGELITDLRGFGDDSS